MEKQLEESVKPKFWHELTEEEKAIIREEDRPRSSVIKGIPSDIRLRIYKSLYYLTSSSNYEKEQKEWLRTEIDLANKREHRDVSNDNSLLDEIIYGSTREEFRIEYALKHPEEVRRPWTEEFSDLFSQIQEVITS